MKRKTLQMKRALRSVLLVLLLSAAGMGKMYAQSFTVGDLNYQVNNDGVSVTVTGHVEGQSATGSLVIPEMVEYSGSNYSVTTIGEAAFYGCSGFTGSLTFPNSVITIGGSAFEGCSGFTGNLTIPNSVTTIDEYAFFICSGFTGGLTIGNSVTTIDEAAFYGCSGFTGSLTFPNSVITIGGSAFEGCSGFTGNLTIPNSVTTIGEWAFRDCSGFTGSLTIGNSVTTIGGSAFRDCSGFMGSLTIPNSVTEIGQSAFSGCGGFTGSLTIGNSVTTIGDYAFVDCSGFTGSLAIPNSVTSLGNSAFRDCSGFTGSLTIGNSVTTIGDVAFNGCYGFSTITSLAETPPSMGNNPFPSFYSNKIVYVPCGYEEEYASLSWGSFNGFIGLCGGTVTVMADPEECGTVTGGGQIEANQLCTIMAIANEGYVFANWTFNGSVVSVEAEYAFYVTSDMTLVAHFVQDGNIAFADSNVKSICVANWDTNGDGELSYAEAAVVTDLGRVFSGKTEITSFEELQYFIGLSNICSYAFYNCSNLSGSLYIPNSVTTINYQAFYGCSGLTGSLTIPNSVTTIGGDAFSGCSGFIGNLTIPNSVTTIGQYAFSGCSGLTGSLTISNSVTEIGDGAFRDCSGLTSVYFTGDLALWCGITFGDYYSNPLYYAHNLYIDNQLVTDLAIPNSVTTIGQYAFYNGSGFTGSLTIPNSVTAIGNSAFSNCNGLTGSLTIPNSVTTIGTWAFSNCSGFTGNLTIGNSVTEIGDGAFCDCIGFTGSLTIPNSVTAIGEMAFSWCSGFTDSLTIGNSVTTIGGSAFEGCSFNGLNVDMVSIPGSFISIVKGSYSGSLTIGNSVTTIGMYAFNNCSDFTGSLTIGNSVTTIGYSAFYNCSGFTAVHYIGNIGQWCNISFSDYSNPLSYAHYLYIDNELVTDLVIPKTVTEIKNYAFQGATCLTSLSIPNSVTSIGGNAFSGCRGFTGFLTIPNSVTTIGNSAFWYCNGFTGDLTIPNSVSTIGDDAFYNCSGFTGCLTIPSSVTTIGGYAFNGCSGLNEIMMFGVTPPSLGYYNTFYNTNNCPIYVPYESLNDYKTATYWSYYEDRIFPMSYTTIPGYGEGEGNYRFIASPLVENTAPTAVDNMITETAYDLYRFDQSEDAEWQNYKFPENTPNFFLTNGQGYLYANAEDVNIIFKGEFNEDDTKEVGLSYDANAEFAGWNLVGNPFPVNAYANKSYYTMNEEGTAVEPNMVSSATAIPACTGVMVMAEAEDETVVFSTEAPETATNRGCLQIALSQAVNRDGVSTGSTSLQDKAIVSFNAGDRLEKFVFNKENAVISIPQGGKELAIACTDKQGEMPLNFKATKNGEYTLTIHSEAVELDYLHLIDNLTGADVDLLVTPTYTFAAKTTDYASRFRLVFSGNEADGPSTSSESFAFINNGNIVFTAMGGETFNTSLQIVDVQGRVIVFRDAVPASLSTAGMTPGVYVLRLVNGDEVRTQKLVVR